MRRRPLPGRTLWLLGLALLALALVATNLGAMRLSVAVLWQAHDEAQRFIWLNIRLPRVLLAALVGGALALSGCVMQGLFRNPLADPGLLGISSGAALAVGLSIVLPLALPPRAGTLSANDGRLCWQSGRHAGDFFPQPTREQQPFSPFAGWHCN